MISPELLRHYPFFAGLTDAQQRLIASVAEEKDFPGGATIFEEGQAANAFYFLLSGSLDLYFSIRGGEIHVGGINPGEPFSISALIPPHILSHTARTASACRAILINAAALRAMCDADCKMGHVVMRGVASAAMERLHFTRVQLAAERA
ncbi:MAG: Crp/Fnr family transcriptional regulator [Chloroflexi bacterium]|nr:Crp/Fnr family transcriptional regulator [Chloroflexota bacterium]